MADDAAHTDQEGSSELHLELIHKVIAELRYRPDSKSPFYTHGHTHVAPMGKWPWYFTSPGHGAAYLQAKILSINLIWSKWALWLLSYGNPIVPRTLMTLVVMPMWPWWTNGHDVAHLLARTIPMNLIWSESAQLLPSYGICKVWAGWTDGRMDKKTNGKRAFHNPPFFLWKGRGTTMVVYWVV